MRSTQNIDQKITLDNFQRRKCCCCGEYPHSQALTDSTEITVKLRSKLEPAALARLACEYLSNFKQFEEGQTLQSPDWCVANSR